MEFYKTKLFGGEVNVLFTGPNYFFFHGFYGVICIAERVDEVELSNKTNSTDEWKSKFVLYSGHGHGDIEKESFALAKKIIEKYDQRYVKKTFEFEEVVTDLNRCFVQVSYDLNRFG
jgi:hypothetical protein